MAVRRSSISAGNSRGISYFIENQKERKLEQKKKVEILNTFREIYEHNARSGRTPAALAPRESHLDNGLSI